MRPRQGGRGRGGGRPPGRGHGPGRGPGRRPGRGGPPRRKGPPDDPKTALSKVLSYALRHQPEEFGLTTDQFGFVPINELLVALRERPKWADLTEEQVNEIVEGSEKRRFEIRDGLIRARYGHSFAVQPPGEPSDPPEHLYHGTPRRAMGVIMEDGLRSMRRKFVHLSRTIDSARQVGLRRDPQPVILEIEAKRAHDSGVGFYAATDDIYLVEHVPSEYIHELRPKAETDGEEGEPAP